MVKMYIEQKLNPHSFLALLRIVLNLAVAELPYWEKERKGANTWQRKSVAAIAQGRESNINLQKIH